MKFQGLGNGLSDSLLAAANAIVLESGDYKKFFQAALKKFGVTSPAELKGDKEKEFYDYIDKNWDGKDEKKEAKIDEDVRDMKNFKNKNRRGFEARLHIGTKGKITKDELTVIDNLISKIKKMHVTSFEGASDEPNSLEFYGDEKSLDKFISDKNVQKIVKKYKGKVNGPMKNESVRIEEVLPTPIDGVAESETFNEKAGKYAKYSDLLMQKARLVAQGPAATKEVGDINKKIASEIKKLGIKEDKGFERILMAVFEGQIEEGPRDKAKSKVGKYRKPNYGHGMSAAQAAGARNRGEETEVVSEELTEMGLGDKIGKLFKTKNKKEIDGLANLLNMTDIKVLQAMQKQNPKGFKRMTAKMGELPAMGEETEVVSEKVKKSKLKVNSKVFKDLEKLQKSETINDKEVAAIIGQLKKGIEVESDDGEPVYISKKGLDTWDKVWGRMDTFVRDEIYYILKKHDDDAMSAILAPYGA